MKNHWIGGPAYQVMGCYKMSQGVIGLKLHLFDVSTEKIVQVHDAFRCIS